MRLFVETMDSTVIEWTSDGRVLLENGQGEQEWIKPSLQETRAIIHAAQQQLEGLTELLEILERSTRSGRL